MKKNEIFQIKELNIIENHKIFIIKNYFILYISLLYIIIKKNYIYNSYISF